jgi:Mg-chelatase subunit ChlD
MITTTSTRKITYATTACMELLTHYFRFSIDRAAIVSAGSTGRLECPFTADLSLLERTLRMLAQVNGHEKTRLWDTLTDAAGYFWQAGRRNVPWIMLGCTDGGDSFGRSPIGAGLFLRRHFTAEPSNTLALVAAGTDSAIDKPALLRFAQAAKCSVFAIKEFSQLEDLFLKIAVQLTTGLSGVRYSMGNLSWTELQRVRSLTHVPVDLMLVIDRSGSMYKEA